MQWLGSWQQTQTETIYQLPAIERTYPKPNIVGQTKAPSVDLQDTPSSQATDDTAGDEGYGNEYDDDAYGDDEYGDEVGEDEDDEYGY